MDITTAIYNKLVGDATLVALIATYGADSPASPAIFTNWPAPPDAARPFIISAGEVSTVHFDEIADNFGIDTVRDVHCYADNTGSALAIETIARRIRTVLHRQPLTIPGGTHTMTICIGGPVEAPTDDSLLGRVLTFRIVAMEA